MTRIFDRFLNFLPQLSLSLNLLGILATPNAFGNSGLLTGAVLLPIVGSIAVHCMHLLVNSHNKIIKRFGATPMDYEDVSNFGQLNLMNSSWT